MSDWLESTVEYFTSRSSDVDIAYIHADFSPVDIQLLQQKSNNIYHVDPIFIHDLHRINHNDSNIVIYIGITNKLYKPCRYYKQICFIVYNLEAKAGIFVKSAFNRTSIRFLRHMYTSLKITVCLRTYGFMFMLDKPMLKF